MPKKVKNDVTDQRFGRLVAIEFIPDDSKFSKFRCVCDCGVQKTVFTQSLIRGLTKSCGCLQKELAAKAKKTHGQWTKLETLRSKKNDYTAKY